MSRRSKRQRRRVGTKIMLASVLDVVAVVLATEKTGDLSYAGWGGAENVSFSSRRRISRAKCFDRESKSRLVKFPKT